MDWPDCGEQAVGREDAGPGRKWRAGSGRASLALLGPWPRLAERPEPRAVARSNACLQGLPLAAEMRMHSRAPFAEPNTDSLRIQRMPWGVVSSALVLKEKATWLSYGSRVEHKKRKRTRHQSEMRKATEAEVLASDSPSRPINMTVVTYMSAVLGPRLGSVSNQWCEHDFDSFRLVSSSIQRE